MAVFLHLFVIVSVLLLTVKHCLLFSIFSKFYYPLCYKWSYIYHSISYYQPFSTEESNLVTLSIVLASHLSYFWLLRQYHSKSSQRTQWEVESYSSMFIFWRFLVPLSTNFHDHSGFYFSNMAHYIIQASNVSWQHSIPSPQFLIRMLNLYFGNMLIYG